MNHHYSGYISHVYPRQTFISKGAFEEEGREKGRRGGEGEGKGEEEG